MNDFFIDPLWYRPLFLHIVVLLSLFQAYEPSPDALGLQPYTKDLRAYWLFVILMTLFIGLRPEHATFGDDYAASYRYATDLEVGKDWLYSYMVYFGHRIGLEWSYFCLLCTAIYFGGSAFAVSKIFPYRPMTALAVVFAAFSFFAYCTNGIRNGLGCSMFFVVLAYYKDRNWKMAALFAVIAAGFHNSLQIPIAAFALCFFYKNTRRYIQLWFASILLSLVVGDFMQTIYQNLGFIDTGRDYSYFLEHDDMSGYTFGGGFRWDFLTYSAVPIWIGYHFVTKLNYQNAYYKLMLNMYIFINSLWVLVNRNWLSNRIAFLSWFMYALVMMYPILDIEKLKNRSKWIVYTVAGNATFSYVMWILDKYK